MTIRTLIADDHELVRAGIRAVLAGDEAIAVVGEAATGQEALALVERLSPQVVLLDARLPDLPGPEVCQAICSRWPGTAVVMLTAFADADLVLACIQAGARGYLIKDVQSMDLRRNIRAAARGEVVLDPKVAHVLVQRVRQPEEPRPAPPPLNRQQLAIIRLVAQGYTNREIAQRLFLSEKTVKGYLAEALRRLGVRNRVEAAMLASRRGWI